MNNRNLTLVHAFRAPALVLERPAAQGGVQLPPGGRSTRTEDEVHSESVPPVVGRAIRCCRGVSMMTQGTLPSRFVLPLLFSSCAILGQSAWRSRFGRLTETFNHNIERKTL